LFDFVVIMRSASAAETPAVTPSREQWQWRRRGSQRPMEGIWGRNNNSYNANS